jgi:hypothetical protein
VLNQEVEAVEVIVVNDCSTDGTLCPCLLPAKNDLLVLVFAEIVWILYAGFQLKVNFRRSWSWR